MVKIALLAGTGVDLARLNIRSIDAVVARYLVSSREIPFYRGAAVIGTEGLKQLLHSAHHPNIYVWGEMRLSGVLQGGDIIDYLDGLNVTKPEHLIVTSNWGLSKRAALNGFIATQLADLETYLKDMLVYA